MTSGILYLICAIATFGLTWLIRVSVVAKFARAHTLNDYLEQATWSEMIVITLISLIPGVNVFIAGFELAFVVFAIICALFTNQLNKPLRRKEQ